MSTETLKLNIVQQIVGLSDIKILEKVNALLNSESIVGYTANGTPIYKSQYISEMEEQQERINNGTAKFYSSEEVRKRIIDANNLGR